MADCTAGSGAQKAVMSGDMTRNAADGRARQATHRAGLPW
jgi:hypothetical protein